MKGNTMSNRNRVSDGDIAFWLIVFAFAAYWIIGMVFFDFTLYDNIPAVGFDR
jgi:hypothetical protein